MCVCGWGAGLAGRCLCRDCPRLAAKQVHTFSHTHPTPQPTPHQLAWFRRQGVRTVISLRGGREHGSWPLQREACAQQGLNLVEFVLRSREAPSKETILAAKAFFDGVQYPAVMHCKSGADRAGLGAALEAGEPPPRARTWIFSRIS